MPLNEIEINYLKNAVNILSQFKGTPQFEWIRDLIPKLNQGFNLYKANHTIVDFDSNPYLKGIDFLTALHHAIFYKKVLLFEYQPFEADVAIVIELHPYYLKQYNNRWFLYGFNPETDRFDWNLALDRINKFEEISKKYIHNESIDWDDYFEDIIGVSKPVDGKLEKIELQFFGKTGKYITSKPIHGSQISKWINETTLEVNLNLIVNYEFEQFILSYGESVKVLYPLSFANKVAGRLSNAFQLYS
ncbi:helix-turn-helix transcriptional regulator [Mucilaginibacter antarcticus]